MIIWPAGAAKKQTQSKPIAGEMEPAQAIPIPMHDSRDEAATQGKLKKQSQFKHVSSASSGQALSAVEWANSGRIRR
jgi:hypothetical protein